MASGSVSVSVCDVDGSMVMTGEDSCSSAAKVAEFFLSLVMDLRTLPKFGNEAFGALGVPLGTPTEEGCLATPNGNRLRRERKDEIPDCGL